MRPGVTRYGRVLAGDDYVADKTAFNRFLLIIIDRDMADSRYLSEHFSIPSTAPFPTRINLS